MASLPFQNYCSLEQIERLPHPFFDTTHGRARWRVIPAAHHPRKERWRKRQQLHPLFQAHAIQLHPQMAERFSSSAVISFFSGEDVEGLRETCYPGSDDDLGMDDSESEDEEGK